MITHLMRNKKDRAIGVKFADLTGKDAVTNMEGAMHTFLTPLVKINMHGDYVYNGYHGVESFENQNGRQQARVVLLSAMVQPDFEGEKVMYQLAALGDAKVLGEDLGPDFTILSVQAKQNIGTLAAYETRLRRHMIQHLTVNGYLPAKSSVKPMSYDAAVKHLSTGGSPIGQYVTPPRKPQDVLSLELLFFSSVEQVINEFSALEALCAWTGYVYTFDPPAIFAQTLGATLLNRLFIAAIAHVARVNPGAFRQLRCFAFNDYADKQAVPLLRAALKDYPHVPVVPKAHLFPPPSGRYDPPDTGANAMLVLHNNSDAFGQNIETEADGGSMDGAIGTHSSAAASLHRQHPHLVDQVLAMSARMRAV